jgi:TolB-like protein/Flp pilus assembly protein TadD
VGVKWVFPPAPQANSIVVLPFEDLTATPGDEFLADAITDELINTLTNSELRVVARTSAFRLKGTKADPRHIGEQLGVETLLTGSIRRISNRVRVSVQLVQARSGFQIWAETYEHELGDALSIEQEIANHVATSLRANLLRSAAGAASAQRSGNWEAHNAYVQGRFYARRRTLPSLQTAIEFYQAALKLDPSYPQAYAGLADAYAYIGVLQPATPELLAKIKGLAGRALQLDPSLAEAHTTLGQIAHLYDWDAEMAETQFGDAIVRNPRDAEARRHYAGLLINLTRYRDARAQLEFALSVDPLSVLLVLSDTLIDFLTGALDAADRKVARLIESDPSIPHAYQLLGLLHQRRGRTAEAISAFRRSVDVSHSSPSFRSYLGYILGICRQPEEARSILKETIEQARAGRADAVDVATVYAGLGEKAAALDWLEKAVSAHSPNMVQLLIRPTWDSLRAEPRFAAILKRVPLFRNVAGAARG